MVADRCYTGMATDRILELTALVRAVELGTFSGAARELGLTASALSKIITRLETRLGARLVHRTSRSLALTAEGVTFVAGARRVLEALADAESEVSRSTARPRGRIRVYSLPTFAYRLVPLLAEFLELYPELTIDVQLGTDRIDLVKYGFDVAIRLGPLEDSGAFSRKICDTGWVVCASPAYLATNGTPRVPADLSQHNCLNFSVHTHTIPWQFADGASPAVGGRFLSNHAELLRLMALRDGGVIRVSDHVVAEDIATGKLVPLLQDHMPRNAESVWALFQSRDHMSARLRIFIDFLALRLAPRPSAAR